MRATVNPPHMCQRCGEAMVAARVWNRVLGGYMRALACNECGAVDGESLGDAFRLVAAGVPLGKPAPLPGWIVSASL